MADIFVSYTSSDRDWAFWIGQELEKLGHVARLHEWDIAAGGDIARWMEERHDSADHILCVVSEAYLKAPYSSWERRAAQWAAASARPNFVVPVFIEPCEPPTLLATIKRCDLHGLEEKKARERLADFLKPAAKPAGPVAFPGARKSVTSGAPSQPTRVQFPGPSDSSLVPERPRGISNIPVTVPRHFLGRENDLAAIDRSLNAGDGGAAIAALHGLRGVGKTTLVAVYAERHRDAYRATWWIKAGTESTLRADLVGLGVQMGWVAADAAEEPAVNEVLKRVASDGRDILLIYDNATTPDALYKFLPRGGAPQIIITSNAPNWGRIAAPVEIEVWPREIGADFLVARTGRIAERAVALALSEALGGLPLAHDQAAAYCERVGISLTEYKKRFDAAPVSLLDNVKDVSRDYHDGLTVARTFSLAIEEAAKLHVAAEPLIVYTSLLAPEPIPLFLFSEGREKFVEPFASSIAGGGLDEAIAALRAFALVACEHIPDERDLAIATDCIRPHRLVRRVAAGRRDVEARINIRCELTSATALVFPREIERDPAGWPQARRLDAIASALVEQPLPPGTEFAARYLSDQLAGYRNFVPAAYPAVRPLA